MVAQVRVSQATLWQRCRQNISEVFHRLNPISVFSSRLSIASHFMRDDRGDQQFILGDDAVPSYETVIDNDLPNYQKVTIEDGCTLSLLMSYGQNLEWIISQLSLSEKLLIEKLNSELENYIQIYKLELLKYGVHPKGVLPVSIDHIMLINEGGGFYASPIKTCKKEIVFKFEQLKALSRQIDSHLPKPLLRNINDYLKFSYVLEQKKLEKLV